MEFVERGPNDSDLPIAIWFYISKKSSVLCQPSLMIEELPKGHLIHLGEGLEKELLRKF